MVNVKNVLIIALNVMIPNVLSVNQILFYLKVVVLRIIAKKNSMMLKHSNVLNAKPNII